MKGKRGAGKSKLWWGLQGAMMVIGLLMVALVIPAAAGLLIVAAGCWWTYQAIMAHRERKAD